MIDAALAAAFEATWPSAAYRAAGGLRVGQGLGAGARVGSARAVSDWSGADLDAAEAIHRGWQQPALFRVTDGDEALAAALEARGYGPRTPTAILEAPVARLTLLAVPSITAFAIWPPLAIQREIWATGGIGPARQQVMARVAGPRAAILGRIEDRAAGAGFAAIHGDVAMIHAIEVLPAWRRRGLAGWMMREAAFWAQAKGAARLALAVTRGNAAALALYRGLGFAEVGGYRYFGRD
ncbi:GNAT family N-acetyltransferase [Paracoccus spongiarum]|uniref:GNAT family N-acetyltransferase n=1 Tax=Paracoccus spongiarum TaxID=3064387 RepID=A0ABT9JB83_9RHOB|nr:GNAT family N-acetyltransferase [Paracoccus sp. 2205BS29-5]MDP5307089.1 GNAT family N-acetyltransferase [Paracoccus sp. 2205BS29-5]